MTLNIIELDGTCKDVPCEHDKRKYLCKQCDGKGICSHGKRKSLCKQC